MIFCVHWTRLRAATRRWWNARRHTTAPSPRLALSLLCCLSLNREFLLRNTNLYLETRRILQNVRWWLTQTIIHSLTPTKHKQPLLYCLLQGNHGSKRRSRLFQRKVFAGNPSLPFISLNGKEKTLGFYGSSTDRRAQATKHKPSRPMLTRLQQLMLDLKVVESIQKKMHLCANSLTV